MRLLGVALMCPFLSCSDLASERKASSIERQGDANHRSTVPIQIQSREAEVAQLLKEVCLKFEASEYNANLHWSIDHGPIAYIEGYASKMPLNTDCLSDKSERSLLYELAKVILEPQGASHEAEQSYLVSGIVYEVRNSKLRCDEYHIGVGCGFGDPDFVFFIKSFDVSGR